MGSKWRLEMDEDSGMEQKTQQVTRSTGFFTLDPKEVIVIVMSVYLRLSLKECKALTFR